MIISYLLVDRIDRYSCLLCRGDKFLCSYLEGFFFKRRRQIFAWTNSLETVDDALSINHFSF